MIIKDFLHRLQVRYWRRRMHAADREMHVLITTHLTTGENYAHHEREYDKALSKLAELDPKHFPARQKEEG